MPLEEIKNQELNKQKRIYKGFLQKALEQRYKDQKENLAYSPPADIQVNKVYVVSPEKAFEILNKTLPSFEGMTKVLRQGYVGELDDTQYADNQD
jgi:hypothetical protein